MNLVFPHVKHAKEKEQFYQQNASLAKTTKCGILPIGITGTQDAKYIPFSGKIIIKIGKLIPYSDNVDEMVEKWTEAIQELTGFKYNQAPASV